MKYYESRFTKFIGSTGFYAIIACCIIAIGAVSWFAVSRYNTLKEEENYQSGLYSKEQDSYTENAENTIEQEAENTTNTVVDEPYEEAETNQVATNETQVQTFIIPITGEISKDFSLSELQYSATYSDMRLHKGIDIACEKGSEAVASSKGIVKSVEESATLGNVVVIDHSNGVEMKYCGLDDVCVAQGQSVEQGDLLGVVSEIPCECADQSHLHLEAYQDGAAISPCDLID